MHHFNVTVHMVKNCSVGQFYKHYNYVFFTGCSLKYFNISTFLAFISLCISCVVIVGCYTMRAYNHFVKISEF